MMEANFDEKTLRSSRIEYKRRKYFIKQKITGKLIRIIIVPITNLGIAN